MKARIEEVLSRILSEKYGAKIEIEFEKKAIERKLYQSPPLQK